MILEIVRTGIILNTERYDECVAFYRGLFNLPIMHEKQQGLFRLTCFELGGCYLMIETGGVASDSEKSIEQNPTKLRFNVADMESALKRINEFGLDANLEYHDWGKTINICDPDGNRIGIRDQATFELKDSE